MDKLQIMNELYIKETDTPDAIREKLLLAAILNQGVDIASRILARYKELADYFKP